MHCRYFVFNDAGRDLDYVIRRRIPFAEQHIQSIIYAILRGLKVELAHYSALDLSSHLWMFLVV